ncbi:Mitochondrial distribution and morphology protein 30 [Wickerhamomyces ciferrii]|uniref:Mitochondrial distribution and morphology protein 30 n=1 Tax=Wickerhamomyces ciferrii (strain ATCC 14091 / BCRC 22168 / CBS 111 / JCM 3599 / NBRC 0793 / NRRL Y-1031 F-60-10) TaxID=1206466 RepID=K0KND9_WICCF|nr:Mitochondrial distribution and morphology protein 30 [Wickerhamomyces ciferrii]CCH44506.1 Mitochondrial distribution and morphology protein 30 [Wickerhamomyces ciferrii]
MASINQNYHFPLEVWENIVSKLGKISKSQQEVDETIFNLGKVNKEFRDLFTGDDFWYGLIKSRYFQNLSDPFLNVSSEISKLGNLYEYSMKRYQIDKEIRFRFNTLDSSPQIVPNEYLNDHPDLKFDKLERTLFYKFYLSNILKYKDLSIEIIEEMIPKLKEKDIFNEANWLLSTVRRIRVYDGIFQAQRDQNKKNKIRFFKDAEGALFDLSHIDPCFEKLKSVRRAKLQQIYKKVNVNPVLDTRDIIGTILIIKDAVKDSLYFEDLHGIGNIESVSLLRVYACESSGFHIVQLAIIQKIAREFGIRTIIPNSKSVLIINDPKYVGDKPYLKIHLTHMTQLMEPPLQNSIIIRPGDDNYDKSELVPKRSDKEFYDFLIGKVDSLPPLIQLRRLNLAIFNDTDANESKKSTVYPISGDCLDKNLFLSITRFCLSFDLKMKNKDTSQNQVLEFVNKMSFGKSEDDIHYDMNYLMELLQMNGKFELPIDYSMLKVNPKTNRFTIESIKEFRKKCDEIKNAYYEKKDKGTFKEGRIVIELDI